MIVQMFEAEDFESKALAAHYYVQKYRITVAVTLKGLRGIARALAGTTESYDEPGTWPAGGEAL